MVCFDETGHMIADSLEELHEFAKKIGLKRCWFQHHGHPHYDLTTDAARGRAIKAGAERVPALVLLHVAYRAKLWDPPSEAVRDKAERAFWEWEALKNGTGVVAE